MSPEKKLEEKIIACAEAKGWFAHHFDANGVDGWPDVLCLRSLEARLIEVKSGTGLRAEQKAFMARMAHEHSVPVYVIEEFSRHYLVTGINGEPLTCDTVEEAVELCL